MDARVPREAEHAIELLLKLAHHVELRDHSSGRMEIGISFSSIPKVLALLQGIDVGKGVQAMPGLENYEVSAWSRSAVINYSPSVLPMDLWNDFCAIRHDPSREEAVRQRLYDVYETHVRKTGE